MSLLGNKILVVGAGASGGLIAARLLEKGADLCLLTGPERVKQIALRGLVVTSQFGRFRKPVNAVSAGQLEGSFDLVILACRAHRLTDTLSSIEAHVDTGTTLLSLVDGAPMAELIRQRLSSCRIADGMLEARTFIDADGVISHRPPAARITLAPSDANGWSASEPASLLTGRGLVAEVSEELPRLKWLRFVYLAAGIATSVRTGTPLRDALRFLPGKTFFAHSLAEGREAAAAHGVPLERLSTWRYRQALYLEGEPVAAPPRIVDPCGAGQEALYLLAQMAEMAEARHISVPTMAMALTMAHEAMKPASSVP